MVININIVCYNFSNIVYCWCEAKFSQIKDTPLSSKASLSLKTECRPLELCVLEFPGILNSIDNFQNDVPKEKQGNNEIIREKYASNKTFSSATYSNVSYIRKK